MDSVDTYELNRRARRPRRGGAQYQSLGYIPPPSPGAAGEQDWGTRQYQSLGYIAGSGSAGWKEEPEPGWAGREAGREERLWSKSLPRAGPLGVNSLDYCQAGGDRGRWPGAPRHGGESYQCNYNVVKVGALDTFPGGDSWPGVQEQPYSSLPVPRPALRQPAPPLLRGLLQHKRDRLFARWHERQLTLTRKHLKCHHKTAPHAQLWKVNFHKTWKQMKCLPCARSDCPLSSRWN